MKITKSVTKVEQVEIPLPVYFKSEYGHFCMIAGENSEGNLYGFKVSYGAYPDRGSMIHDILWKEDVEKKQDSITAEEFWDAYHEAKDRLSKKEFLCKAAAIDAGHEEETTVNETSHPELFDFAKKTAEDYSKTVMLLDGEPEAIYQTVKS